jgi:hypothetical protein
VLEELPFFRADACAARITSSFLDLDRICLKVADIYNSYWAQLQIVCRLFNIKKAQTFVIVLYVCYCPRWQGSLSGHCLSGRLTILLL